MFWHTARDDTMFTIMRCISRHEKTQVYGVILPQHLANQAMLESNAYKTYYAYATGKKTPKLKYVLKKVDSDTSPKKKPAQATKGFILKTLAKVVKSDKKKKPNTVPKTKGLIILSEVALSEAEQMKLATKRSKTHFHISHASGSGDGVDTQSKVPDEQQLKVTGINEGACVRPEVPDVPKYDSESEEESWTFSQGDDDDDADDDEDTQEEEEEKADDEEVSSDQKVSTPPDHELTKEEENQEGDDNVKKGEQEEEEEEELYKDLNLNMERRDAEMTNALANQDTEDTHVTLTVVPPPVLQKSPSASSNLVSKFINPSPITGIDSILNQHI
ncbi:hypothetical protein Tco_1065608 [Tanacetum coccineum]